jgi:ubiquinone/menaquinone biosynthesis C-methylase UbiE
MEMPRPKTVSIADPTKRAVYDFFETASCGEKLLLTEQTITGYAQQAARRYQWEPEIIKFAEFPRWNGKRVLEIGVGLGADHEQFARAGAVLYGLDLTPRAVRHTRQRLDLLGLRSTVMVADAEGLPYASESFDLVFSWGVILNCPNIQKAVYEIHRVLKRGGEARVMIYHKWSMVGYMLWVRYALMRLRPWLSLKYIYCNYLENYGTQAFTVAEARRLFSLFGDVMISITLSHGDLLTSEAGQRHRGPLLDIARAIWPRWLIRKLLKKHGLFMMIRAVKAS